MIRPIRAETGGVVQVDLKKLPSCTLTKLASDNGLWAYRASAYIGESYKYIPESRETRKFFNQPSQLHHEADTVLVYDRVNDLFGLMPVECLNLNPTLKKAKRVKRSKKSKRR